MRDPWSLWAILRSGEAARATIIGQQLFTRAANGRFKFDKRSQLFIRVHDETLSVVPMCVTFCRCSKNTRVIGQA